MIELRNTEKKRFLTNHNSQGLLPVSHNQKWKKRSETVPLSIENLLLKYEDNLNDSDIVREANLFLHH